MTTTKQQPCLPGCGCECGHADGWHSFLNSRCKYKPCNCKHFQATSHVDGCHNREPEPAQYGCHWWCKGDDHDHYCPKRAGNKCQHACNLCDAKEPSAEPGNNESSEGTEALAVEPACTGGNQPKGLCDTPRLIPPSAEPADPLKGMDGREWAREFLRIWGGRWEEVDEGLMIAWFANAIMRGYDEATWKNQRTISDLQAKLNDALIDAQGVELNLHETEAKLDAAEAKLSTERDSIGNRYKPNSMCQDGHEMILWRDSGEFEQCPLCRINNRPKRELKQIPHSKEGK